jgi:hypothetical protein
MGFNSGFKGLINAELMIACELFKKQPAGTKIGSQTHTQRLYAFSRPTAAAPYGRL